MKKTFDIILGIGLMLTTVSLDGSIQGRNPDSTVCLELEGKILNSGEGTDPESRIELICNNTVVEEIVLKKGSRKFSLLLKKNKHYVVRLSKTGYLSKLICIDTRLSEELNGVYEFAFETTMVKQTETVGTETSETPIAIVYFDGKRRCFNYSKDTSNMRKELYLTKAN